MFSTQKDFLLRLMFHSTPEMVLKAYVLWTTESTWPLIFKANDSTSNSCFTLHCSSELFAVKRASEWSRKVNNFYNINIWVTGMLHNHPRGWEKRSTTTLGNCVTSIPLNCHSCAVLLKSCSSLWHKLFVVQA